MGRHTSRVKLVGNIISRENKRGQEKQSGIFSGWGRPLKGVGAFASRFGGGNRAASAKGVGVKEMGAKNPWDAPNGAELFSRWLDRTGGGSGLKGHHHQARGGGGWLRGS